VKVYVMIGAPGAGKGTQADILAGRLGLLHVASGDLFRDAVRNGTQLGRDAKRYMDRGALVPDPVVIGMIEERMEQPDAAAGVVLDGFPRTRAQAEALDAALAARGARVDAALYVGVPEDELVRRLSSRWLCRAAGHVYNAVSHPPAVPGICDIDGSELYQRDDDRPETVRARLAQQLPPMYDVIDYYTVSGVLVAVDGAQSIEAVTEALLRAISGPGPTRPEGSAPA
jgi:adenylate kinase